MKFIRDRLWAQILVGLFLGALLGYVLGPDFNLVSRDAANTAASWLALPGNLFLDVIRFIVIPLVLSSVALGISNGGNAKQIRKLGLSIVVYFMATTAVASTISVLVTWFLKPGALFDKTTMDNPEAVAAKVPHAASLASDIPSTISNLIPTNPFSSMAEGNMLEIIIAAAIFGTALLVMKKKEAEPLVHFLNSVQAASLTVINFIMKFAPIAVFGLISKVMIVSGFGTLEGLSAYIGTFILILTLILVFYSLVLLVIGTNPLDFAKKIREPFVLAFSTSSSSATMPVTLQTAETKLGINPTVSRMVIPLGTTINMDGTAAYQACVVVFLAQVFNIDLSLGQIITLVMLSITASIGAPGTPGGVLAILVGVLATFGIPPEGFALVLAVDRILDMSRTTVNVTGDLVTSCVIQKISGLPKNPVLKSTA